jgi:hypothetical protein
MPETITCPFCQRRLLLPEQVRGTEVRCPSCQTVFRAGAEPCLVVVAAIDPQPSAPRPDADPPLALPAAPAGQFAWADRPPPRRKSRVLLYTFAGVVVGFGLLVVLGTWLQTSPRPQPQISPRAVRPLDRPEVRAALGGGPLPADPRAPQLAALLQDLGTALRTGNGPAIVGHFDVDRMFDELAAQGALPAEAQRKRQAFVTGMRQGLQRSMTRRGQLLSWDSFEIRSVKSLRPNEVAVIVCHHSAQGGDLKMRWWMCMRQLEWKVYDLEDLDMGMRVSTSAAAVTEMGLDKARDIGQAMTVLGEAMTAVAQEDPDAAERKLRQIAAERLPRPAEAVRMLVRGIVALQRDKSQEALDALGRARALHPDMPVLDLLEGTALNRL